MVHGGLQNPSTSEVEAERSEIQGRGSGEITQPLIKAKAHNQKDKIHTRILWTPVVLNFPVSSAILLSVPSK